MVCHYCGAPNHQDEHRCLRCGRRAHEAFFSAGSEALAPAPLQATAPVFESLPSTAKEPRQTSFAFTARPRSTGRVVSISEFRPAIQEQTTPPVAGKAVAPPTAGTIQRQAKIDFENTAPNLARRVSGARAVRRTAHESAAPLRRLISGVLDAAVVGLMLVPVAIVISSVFGHAWLGDKVKHFYCALGVVIFALYKVAWACVDEDSLGVQWCGLQLINFDHKLPSKRERFIRMAWAVLSTLPGGIGLIWAFVEQDKLTWHDVSTRTYLSAAR